MHHFLLSTGGFWEYRNHLLWPLAWTHGCRKGERFKSAIRSSWRLNISTDYGCPSFLTIPCLAFINQAILKGALLHGQSGVRRSFVQELSMLSQLHHPNICSFYGASVDPPRLAIIMQPPFFLAVFDQGHLDLNSPCCCTRYFLVIEYMDQGSLWSFLRECPEEIDFFNVALQVVGVKQWAVALTRCFARLMSWRLGDINGLLVVPRSAYT